MLWALGHPGIHGEASLIFNKRTLTSARYKLLHIVTCLLPTLPTGDLSRDSPSTKDRFLRYFSTICLTHLKSSLCPFLPCPMSSMDYITQAPLRPSFSLGWIPMGIRGGERVLAFLPYSSRAVACVYGRAVSSHAHGSCWAPSPHR